MLARVFVAFAVALAGSATSCSEQTTHAVAAPEGTLAAGPAVAPKKNAAVCEAPSPIKVDMTLGGTCAIDAD